ncbi:MAG: class I SAM-dependent methyltransferase [Chloracidobacterium sp.]|nr:class I SAM-dependent methyltransferase [Chloracidobacterium sp.]
MNMIHHWLCQSPGWRKAIKTLVPWAMEGLTLGRDVLEIGPGFGVTTDLIRPAVENLTCVEIDSELAQSLRGRMTGEGVKVLCENATSMSIESASFDAVVCFTMLHHVPSPLMQDRLFSEVARVLRPGGIFLGTDSLHSRVFRMLHLFDTMVVAPPQTHPDRLRTAGFAGVDVDVGRSAFRFRARKTTVKL